jgi:hypothetical protein
MYSLNYRYNIFKINFFFVLRGSIYKTFFQLILIFICSNSTFTQIKKTTEITLLNKGFIKVECKFSGKSNSSIRYCTDMVKSYSNLENVIVKLNGENLSGDYYTAGVHKDTDQEFWGAINFNKYLEVNSDIDVFMSFEVKVNPDNVNDGIILQFGENILKSDKPANVDYKIVIRSEDGNYIPLLNNFQKNFDINEFSNAIVLSESYASLEKNTAPRVNLVEGIMFQNPNIETISEASRTIEIIDIDEVEEYFDINLKGVESGHIFLTFPLKEINEFTVKPEINVNVDGFDLIPYKLTEDEFTKFNFGSLESPLKFMYYFGEDPHKRNNIILLALKMKEDQTGQLKIKFSYNPRNYLWTIDGFNYTFKFFSFFYFDQKRAINNYYNFVIPKNFVINNINIKKDTIENRKNSITYNFVNYVPKDTLVINYARTETYLYDIFRVFNIILLITSYTIFLFILIRIIPYDFIKIKHKEIYAIVTFVYPIILGKITTSNFWGAIKYTWAWVPFIVIMSLLIFSLFVKEKQ